MAQCVYFLYRDIDVYKRQIYINTGEGVLKVTQLQLEGKKRMQVKDFLLGCRMEKGEMLGC